MKVKQLYDAYPSSSLLDIPFPVTAETTLADLERLAASDFPIGDTLFMLLCRELCDPNDEIDKVETEKRLTRATRQLADVTASVFPSETTASAKHLATLISSQLYGLMQLEPGQWLRSGLGYGPVIRWECVRTDVYRFAINDGQWISVGNIVGAMKSFIELALTLSKLVAVTPDGVILNGGR